MGLNQRKLALLLLLSIAALGIMGIFGFSLAFRKQTDELESLRIRIEGMETMIENRWTISPSWLYALNPQGGFS